MSANQAMSSARRRRGAPPTKPIQRRQEEDAPSFPTGNVRVNPAPKSSSVNSATAGDGSFTPVTVREANTPAELLLQHDKRLFNLENGMTEALSVINANIDVLTDGYSALSQSDGASLVEGLRAELRALARRVAELEGGKTDEVDGEETMEISFPEGR